MELSIKTLDGARVSIKCEKTDSIAELKKKIAEQTGISPEGQRLIHCGVQTDDKDTASMFALEGMLHLIRIDPETGNQLPFMVQRFGLSLFTSPDVKAQARKKYSEQPEEVKRYFLDQTASVRAVFPKFTVEDLWDKGLDEKSREFHIECSANPGAAFGGGGKP